MRMKKLVFSLLVVVVVLTSCREKEKPHNLNYVIEVR